MIWNEIQLKDYDFKICSKNYCVLTLNLIQVVFLYHILWSRGWIQLSWCHTVVAGWCSHWLSTPSGKHNVHLIPSPSVNVYSIMTYTQNKLTLLRVRNFWTINWTIFCKKWILTSAHKYLLPLVPCFVCEFELCSHNVKYYFWNCVKHDRCICKNE